MKQNNKIEEEFDEWYQANCGINSVPHPSRIKEFLLQTIQQSRQELIKEIEGMEKDLKIEEREGEAKKLMTAIFGDSKTPDYLIERRMGYNLALSDIISHIKK